MHILNNDGVIDGSLVKKGNLKGRKTKIVGYHLAAPYAHRAETVFFVLTYLPISCIWGAEKEPCNASIRVKCDPKRSKTTCDQVQLPLYAISGYAGYSENLLTLSESVRIQRYRAMGEVR